MENYQNTLENEIIHQVIKNLNEQTMTIIEQHPEEVNGDNYWHGIIIGLETSKNLLTDKLNYQMQNN